MISGSALLSLFVTLVILGLIFWLVLWFLAWVAVPEPFNKIIKVVVGLFVLIYLMNLLLGMSGHPLLRYP